VRGQSLRLHLDRLVEQRERARAVLAQVFGTSQPKA